MFSDEDIKRLEEAENALLRSYGIPALLKRLQVAEQSRAHHLVVSGTSDCQCAHCIAWRKAAGKEK